MHLWLCTQIVGLRACVPPMTKESAASCSQFILRAEVAASPHSPYSPGVHTRRDTPDPIPNSAVKPLGPMILLHSGKVGQCRGFLHKSHQRLALVALIHCLRLLGTLPALGMGARFLARVWARACPRRLRAALTVLRPHCASLLGTLPVSDLGTRCLARAGARDVHAVSEQLEWLRKGPACVARGALSRGPERHGAPLGVYPPLVGLSGRIAQCLKCLGAMPLKR